MPSTVKLHRPSADELHRRRSEAARTVWRKRRAKMQGYQEAPIVGVSTRYVPTEADLHKMVEARKEGSGQPTGDPWHDLPLHQALANLAQKEAELKHAREVITRRTDLLPKLVTCWTALNRKEHAYLPGMYAAYAKCAKTFLQEKAKFRDDCVINPHTKLIDPVWCCSNTCYELYMCHRARLKLKQRDHQNETTFGT